MNWTVATVVTFGMTCTLVGWLYWLEYKAGASEIESRLSELERRVGGDS